MLEEILKALNAARVPLDMLDDKMLSLKQVAELDGTSIDTVKREIKRGRLKATKISERRWGMRRSDYRAARGASDT